MNSLDVFKSELAETVAKQRSSVILGFSGLDGVECQEALRLFMKELPNLPPLTHLELSGGEITADGFKSLAQAGERLHGLSELSLDGSSLVESEMEALASLLRQVPSVGNLTMTSSGIGALSTSALTAFARSCGHLHTLSIYWDALGSKGLRALLEGSRTWSRLRTLVLVDCAISSDGIRALGQSANHLLSLQELTLSGNPLGDAGCVELARVLPRLPPLRQIRLEWCDVHHRGVVALSAQARKLEALHELDLTNNRIGYLGAQDLAMACVQMRCLRKLDLSDMGLRRDAAVECLLSRIDGLSELVHLNAGQHKLSALELRRLGSALPGLDKLETLDLANCGMDAVGLAVLIDSVARPLNLTRLVLSRNRFGTPGVEVLLKGREMLPRLRVLELDDTGIDAEGVQALAQAAHSEPWRFTLRSIKTTEYGVHDEFDLLGIDPKVVYPDSVMPRYAPGSRPVREMNVAILGEGRVGKTHLRNRVLSGNVSYYDRTEASTHDISTTRRRFEKVIVGVHDFGGQVSLSGAHRMYLSGRRSVFIIVCDATRSRADNRVDYWMRVIRYETEYRCPIIIVITKCDVCDAKGKSARRLEVLDAQDLRATANLDAEYPLHVIDGMGWATKVPGQVGDPRWRTHCAAIDDCDDALQAVLDSVPELHVNYPSAFSAVLMWCRKRGFENLRRESTSHISVGRFWDACRECELPESQWSTALETAGALGLVQYVGDRGSVRSGDALGDTIFNPEWVRYPMYRVIRETEQRGRSGVLSWEDIETILPEHAGTAGSEHLWERLPFAATDRARLIDVMVGSGVLFEMPSIGGPCEYVLPDVLERRGVNKPLLGDHVWKREFEWLPETAVGRLVGRLQQQSHESRPRLWRDEVEIDVGRCVLLSVRATRAEVSGAQPRGGRRGTVLWLSVSGCPEVEAARLLGVVDVEMRIILKEAVLEESKWVKVNAGRGAVGQMPDRPYPAFARHAVLLFTVVKSAYDQGGVTVKDYPDLVVWAERILRTQGGSDGNPELAAAIRWARANPQLVDVYLRRARHRPWWTTRGRPRGGRSITNSSGEMQEESTNGEEDE